MTDYRAEHIQVLEGIEAVRKRPGMYIGGTGLDGLHHLIWEIVANSVDEALAGYAKNIEVVIESENRIRISDDGRGIPVEIHPKTKKSALETVLTILHAGGKFDQKIYKSAGGLHGVGVSVVNALSKYLKAIVKRDGYVWTQEYKQGRAITELKKGKPSKETGTTIIFEPDPQIFPEIKWETKRILDYLRHQAYLTPGLRINFIDERNNFRYSFYFEKGLQSFFEHLILNKNPVIQDYIYFNEKGENFQLEVAFTYLENNEINEYFFTNNILNAEGGTHQLGFRSALVKIFNKVGSELGLIKETSGLTINSEDIRGGLIVILSLKIPEPQFEGQTKAKLGNPEAKNIVEDVVSRNLEEYLHKNPDKAKTILNRVLLNTQARKAAKAARETIFKKRIQAGLTLSGKLADCSSRDPEKRELFVVEGDSAGGSAKQGRNRIFQAVLPLRGKILNVEKANLEKILKSQEIKNLIIALGTGFGKDFNLEGLRYSKIIIATDADSDGNHIRTLLLTLFYRYMRPLIEQGFIYIAQPPLYKIQVGKEIYYAYSDAEKDKIIADLTQTKRRTSQTKRKQLQTLETQAENKSINIDVQRYKGLGEMNPEELWETTLNPEKRVLKKVTIEDAEEADRLFTILMGQEVEPRKLFIETYAQEVKNLDI
ncbi:MAG: DNA gyrase subunit B [Candidatus Parcubacteria bacterium]|nr:MAG: DNA gyrase subunit B [Candidatus Parcubacteria bacterium]